MAGDRRLADRDARASSGWPPPRRASGCRSRRASSAIRAKGIALTEYAIALHDAWLAPLGFTLGSPRDGRAGAARTSRSGGPDARDLTRRLIEAGVDPRLPGAGFDPARAVAADDELRRRRARHRPCSPTLAGGRPRCGRSPPAMTEPRDDGRYEVPVGRWPAAAASGAGRAVGRACRSRSWSVARSAWPGCADGTRAARRGDPVGRRSPARQRVPGPMSVGVEPPTPLDRRPPRSSSSSTSRTGRSPGAPPVMVVEQDGLDLDDPGLDAGRGPRRPSGRSADAVPERDRASYPVLAPAGDRIVLLVARRRSQLPAPDATGGQARLLDRDGRVLWTADGLAGRVGRGLVGRRPDGRPRRQRAALARRDDRPRRRPRPTGSSRCPARSSCPSPTPIGSISIPRLDPRTDPARVLGRRSLGLRRRRLARARHPDRRVPRVAPTGDGRTGPGPRASAGPTAWSPQPGTLGGRLDRSGGRPDRELAGEPRHDRRAADPRGPQRRRRVRASSSTSGTPLGSGWGDDGGLYVLDGRLPPATRAGRRSSGSPGRDCGPAAPRDRAGHERRADRRSRNGYAAMVISVTRPSNATQIVLVDLADPTRVTALDLPTTRRPRSSRPISCPDRRPPGLTTLQRARSRVPDAVRPPADAPSRNSTSIGSIASAGSKPKTWP